MDYLVSSSSIKEFLFDATNTDAYGVIKKGTKRDCLDVGNQFNYFPFPYVCYERKSRNVSHTVSSQEVPIRRRGVKSHII